VTPVWVYIDEQRILNMSRTALVAR
jgi:hypothetical protein